MIIQNRQTAGGLQRLGLFIVIISGIALILSFKNVETKLSSHILEYGKASYYGHPFIGRKTASGEVFTEYDYTCAHKTLPFGTKLKVTNLANNESIIVRVNDRGPFVKSRVIDLSIQGARELGLLQSGVANVTIELVHNQFSSLGNTRNMEKVVVDNQFAYIHAFDNEKFDKLFQYLSETDQLDNIDMKELDAKKYSPTNDETVSPEDTPSESSNTEIEK